MVGLGRVPGGSGGPPGGDQLDLELVQDVQPRFPDGQRGLRLRVWQQPGHSRPPRRAGLGGVGRRGVGMGGRSVRSGAVCTPTVNVYSLPLEGRTFDTLFAEGQRRYVESLSAYARQFLEQMEKPDVDSIEGLSPAISIEQKTTSKNPRSTVGTVTEIHDSLRLLFASIGQPHCVSCGREISAQTIQQMTDRILAMPEGTRFLVLAPFVRGKKGEYRRQMAEFAKKGFVRARVDGETVESMTCLTSVGGEGGGL